MTMNVQGPGGITVAFPDGTDPATIDQVMRQATGGEKPAAPNDRGAIDAGIRGIANVVPFLDEGVGALGGAINWAQGGSFGEGYDRAAGNARGMDQAAAEQHPYAFYGGQGAATLATLPLAPELAIGKAANATRMVNGARALTLGAKATRGAETGAAYSALYGAGAADGDLGDRAAGALKGAAIGAATGGALPVIAKGIGLVGKPVADAVMARVNPAGFAARKVVDRMSAGGRSVDEAAHRMADAAANGDSLSLLDVGGKQLQRLGRTVANTPGPGSTTITARANLEAMGQGGRLADRVTEGLGTPGQPYQDAKVAIMDARSHAAEPHYREFYRTPVPFTHRLEEVLNTPAGRAGLATARTNSLNRREPWAQWFMNVGEDGRILDARRVPDARALDEVRRAVRAQMEAAMAAPHGQPFAHPRDTPQSIAIRSVYNDLTDEMMAAGETRAGARNGPFARANAAGLDNIQADEAIEFGRSILTTDPRIITRRMAMGGAGRDRVFNEGQRDLVRIGAEDAIRQKLGDTNFTHNGLLKFFSSRTDLQRLRPLFRSPQDWQRFRTSMFNEVRKRAKYDAIKSNSTTAAQLADMNDAGQLGDMAQAGVHAVQSGPIAAAANLLVRGLRRVGGLTPQVSEQVARLVSTRDIGHVRGIIRQLDNIAISRANQAQKLNAARNLMTKALAASEGQALQPAQPRPSAAQ